MDGPYWERLWFWTAESENGDAIQKNMYNDYAVKS